MKKKETWKKVGILAIMALLLVACGSESSEETVESSDVTEEASLSGNLLIWEHDPSFEEPLNAIVEAFSEEYPNVNVQVDIKGGSDYYPLLTTALQSQAGPDVFWTNGTATDFMATYVQEDKVIDITDKVDMSNLAEESYDLTQIDGKSYSVPWMAFDARAVYYNKDIYTELNLEVPETFSQFEENLAVIHEAGYVPISLAGMSSWQILWVFESILAAQSPEYSAGLADYSVAADADEARAAMSTMVDWAEKGYFGEGFLGVDTNGQTLAFTTGSAAMTIDGSWMISTIQENNPALNLGAFQIPNEDGTKTMMGSYANGFSANADSDEESQAAALAFLNFVATNEAQAIWVEALQAISGSEDVPSAEGIAQEISDADGTVGTWQSVLTKHSSEDKSAASIWEEEAPSVFTGTETVDGLFDKIGDAMQ